MSQRIFLRNTGNPAKDIAKGIFSILESDPNFANFSDTLVVSPTRYSGNLIAKEILNFSSKNGSEALCGLEFISPENFLNEISKDYAIANIFDSFGAFASALKKINFEDFPYFLGKIKNPQESIFGIFKLLLSLKSICAESSKTLQDAAKIISEKQIEDTAKWGEFAKLESLYQNELKNIQKIDAHDAQIDFLKSKNSAFKTKNIILAGLADAPEIFYDILQSLEEKNLNLKILILGDSSSEFDEFGRPLPIWQNKKIEIENSQIILCADQGEQAKILAAYVQNPDCAVAAEEGESTLQIIESLKANNIKAETSEKESFSNSDVFSLMQALRNFYSKRIDFYKLISLPPILKYLSAKLNFQESFIIKTTDIFKEETLIKDLEIALNFENKNEEISSILSLLNKILNKPENVLNSEFLSEFLNKIFAEYSSYNPNFSQICTTVFESIDSLKKSEKRGFEFSLETAIRLVLLASEKHLNPESSEDAIEIKNWIEIFWSDKTNIFLADFNEGKVPQKILGDAFLPDSLRTALKIRNSASRHSRDAYMLDSILKAKKNIKFFVPKLDFTKEPLKPSRLLLQNPPKLLDTIDKLFKEKSAPKTTTNFQFSWNLNIPFAKLPKTLGATDFKTYLDCPFRFYLERILKLNVFDSELEELNALQLGSITHYALQNAQSDSLESPEEIFESYKKSFEYKLKKDFGANYPAAVKLQAEFFLSRLKAASAVEAQHRQLGWKTIAKEKSFENLEIEGFKIKMRIDRIDQNENGDILIIDYKTSDTANAKKDASIAASAHIAGTIKAGEDVNWKDLQLPLYYAAVKKEYDSDNIKCAYFCLPKSTAETQISIWNDISDYEKSAFSCAENVCKSIKLRKFLPSEKSKFADYYADYFAFAKGHDFEQILNFENE